MKKLIRLTNADKIRWRRWRTDIIGPSNPNEHEAYYKQWIFVTEWLQDESPRLWINFFTLTGSYYGIQKLIQIIRKQYQRLKLYEYSGDKKRSLAADRAQAKKVEAMEREKLDNVISKLLKADE